MSVDRPILITGGAGFIGSNLAHRLASSGRSVIVLDSLARPGVDANLNWLRATHGERVEPVIADIRDRDMLAACVERADAVFHMAAQVAVTTSLDDPVGDFAVNLGGTLSLLEAARSAPHRPPVIFASTNKVYGDLADIDLVAEDGAYLPRDPVLRSHGVGEDRPLDFHTPYGCSKGGADQYVLDYARSYGLRTAVLRMSCIYGERQMGTEDQGWVAHFLIRALRGDPITLYGDGMQVRDILEVEDAVAAYLGILDRIDTVSGCAFNLGGGPANAVSLRQILTEIEGITGRPVRVGHEDWRAGDQRYFVADTRRLRDALGLGEPTPWRDGVARLAHWLSGRNVAAPHFEAQQVPA